MIKSTVEPECTGQFSPLFLDYLKQKPELRKYYNQFPTVENFKPLIEGKEFSQEKRETLARVLESQYSNAGMDIPEHTKAQIQALKQANTFTVTTGHQLNLFTGPLYFIYKIVSTINLAERLKAAYPEHHFIPVYWIATEDHDFDEINYFKLDGKKYQWLSDQTGPVGAFQLDESFKSFFKEVSHFVPDFFKEAYLGSETLAEAGRKYVHHLFGEKGLLIVDGNHQELKKLFIPVIKEDLLGHRPHDLANRTTAELEEMGYKSQIYPREINFFYMKDSLRERIEKSGQSFYVLNSEITFSEAEILHMVEQHPERFSPNVVLRPLYEETILPNLAYLGGPAEVAYWLQLKPIFDYFGVQFPALMPRNFALVLDSVIQRKINKLGLTDQALFQSVEEWKREFVSLHASMDISLQNEKEALAKIFEASGQRAAELEKSLGNAFEAAKVRAGKIMDQLAGKVRKAEERKQGNQIRQREEVQAYLYPGGSPQERIENFMKFYLSDPDFVENLYGFFDPLNFDYIILKTENG